MYALLPTSNVFSEPSIIRESILLTIIFCFPCLFISYFSNIMLVPILIIPFERKKICVSVPMTVAIITTESLVHVRAQSCTSKREFASFRSLFALSRSLRNVLIVFRAAAFASRSAFYLSSLLVVPFFLLLFQFQNSAIQSSYYLHYFLPP